MTAVWWLILGGSILTVGDIIFRFWVHRPVLSLFIPGLLVYVVGLLCLIQSFKSENIAVASALFVIFNVLTLLVVSWLFFGDHLSWLKILGVIFALIAIIILETAK